MGGYKQGRDKAGTGSLMLSEVPRVAVRVAPGRLAWRLRSLSRAKKMVAWLGAVVVEVESSWFHGCLRGKLDDT